MDRSGSFVITWKNSDDQGDRLIVARMYDRQGVPLSGQFQVNTSAPIDYPDVAMNSHGAFVICWTGGDGANQGIVAQLYAGGGSKIGGEIPVNTVTTSSQDLSAVAMDESGDFVIAWQSNGQDGSLYGIYAQRFNAFGQKQAGEIPVNTFLSGEQRGPTRSPWTPMATLWWPGPATAKTAIEVESTRRSLTNRACGTKQSFGSIRQPLARSLSRRSHVKARQLHRILVLAWRHQFNALSRERTCGF